jgi:parallel beta-helix repeat protein
MATYNESLFPESTGYALGSTTQRWGTGYFQNLDLSTALTVASIAGIKFVDGATYTTIQAAITAASTTGAVVIPPTYSGSDTFTNPNNILIVDLRRGPQSWHGFVNTREWGTVGDGVTDDATAFNNALTAVASSGKTLYTPAGSYLIGSSLLIRSNTSWIIDNQAIFTLKAATNAPLLCNQNRAGYVSIAASGVPGASRAANVVTITTTGPHGITAGQTVLISQVTPVGATNFNGTFVVASTPTSTTFTYAQTASNDTGGGGSVTVSGSGNTNIVIIGGQFDGNGSNQTATRSVPAIQMQEVSNSWFENITVKAAASTYSNRDDTNNQIGAFDLLKCTRNYVRNCSVSAAWNEGLTLRLSTYNQIFGGHYNNNTLGSGVDDTSGSRNAYMGVEAISNGASCMSLNSTYNQAIGCRCESSTTHGMAVGDTGFDATGTIVRDCIFLNNTKSGITVQGSNSINISVINCYAEGNGSAGNPAAGFQNANSATRIKFNGNTAYNNYYGIRLVNSSASSIIGNTVYSTSAAGITIDASPNCIVSDNLVENSGVSVASSNGIDVLTTSSNFVVVGNRVFDSQGSKTQVKGINIVPAQGLAANNLVYGNKTNGYDFVSGVTTNNTLVTNTTQVTATNPSVATDLMTISLPADTLNTTAKGIRIYAEGVYTTNAGQTPTFTISLKLGSVTLVPIASAATTASATNMPWSAEFYAVTVTTGASGTMEAHGKFTMTLGTTATAAAAVYSDTNTAVSSAIDLTAANTLAVRCAFSSADAGNSIKQRLMTIDTFN